VKADPLPDPVFNCEGGRKRVLSVEDWAEIRRLHRAEGMPIKMIARTLGCSKNTVKKALSASGPPSYCRAPVRVGGRRGGAVDP
jgi:transposase